MSLRITAEWLTGPIPQSLCRMLISAGHEAWFVGGCVRNELLGQPISDVDIATDALPEKVMTLAREAGFQPVPTGIAHGTVTVVVKGKPFEVTTFRRDVETDGRRATVAFADTIWEDAHRRDFTINALYASVAGYIEDPLGGLADLKARRIRFIDNAADRIREDYLRILRFFRFHAWYGDPEAGPDREAMTAISELSQGIDTLSRERVGAEMIKLLAAPDPSQSLNAMDETGVLNRVLPEANSACMPDLIRLEGALGVHPEPLRRLACLDGHGEVEQLRLSKAQARRLRRLKENLTKDMLPEELGYRLGLEDGQDVALLQAAVMKTALPKDLKPRLTAGAAAVFPVRAEDLPARYRGAQLGAKLRELENRWISSGFRLGRSDLLEAIE